MSDNSKTLFDAIRSTAPSTKSNSYTFKVLIAIITVIICSVFFAMRMSDNSKDYEKKPTIGFKWHGEDIIAGYSFPIYKLKSKYNLEVEKAEATSIPGFLLNITNEKKSYQVINGFKKALLKDSVLNSSNANKLEILLLKYTKNVFEQGYVNIKTDDIKSYTVIIETPDSKRKILKTNTLFDTEKIKDYFFSNIDLSDFSGVSNQNIEQEIIDRLVPNFIFSEQITKQNKQIAIQNILKTEGFVSKGDVLLAKNELVNEDHIKIINSYNEAKSLEAEADNSILNLIGSIGHVLLIVSFIFIYAFKIKEVEYFDNIKFLLISLFLISTTVLAWLSLVIEINYPLEYLIFLPAFSMLAAIVFDTRIGFYLTVTMSLTIAGLRGNDYSLAVMMMFAGFMAIFSVRDIENRNQIFKSIFLIFIGFIFPLAFFGLETSMTFDEMLSKAGFASINSALSPLITFGLLFILEKTTSISTNLSVLEYDNLNHPLLQKLNELAPGTYQHSLGVSALAQKCADAIGANTLICKVTPYYHDIGKIEKPEYFAENQIGIENKHNLISPIKSAEIIKNHVSIGRKLAESNKLPKYIIDIINTHHGTTVIKHFYAKAVELNQDDPDKVNKKNFTYNGPTPFTKEQAIIMICDQVEAISRIEGKTHDEINIMIQEIINDMVVQRQFDNCEITTKDLVTIKKVLIKQISGMGHKRVDYKKIKQ